VADIRLVVVDIDELQRLIIDAVRTATSERRGSDDWVDGRSSGLGRRLFLRLAREGAFPVSKRGKTYVARRIDVDACLERQRIHRDEFPRKPLSAPPNASSTGGSTDENDDPVERALAAGRLRVVKKTE
jgi:hypothetical protein